MATDRDQLRAATERLSGAASAARSNLESVIFEKKQLQVDSRAVKPPSTHATSFAVRPMA